MNGIILINKEKGCTSHDVVYKVKKLTNSKVGHTGTLDPNATGVLPLLLGEATKISKYLINHDKEYEVVLSLGKKTSTADVEGEVIEEKEVATESLERENVENVLNTFVGKQEQIPPIYSAIKVNGKKLYEYARKGQEVKIEPRQIEIYGIELLNIDEKEKQISFRVRCSKGTYIRSLCEDIAKKLGTVGYMKELKRTVVGNFKIENAITVEELKEKIEAGDHSSIITIEEIFKQKGRIDLQEQDYSKYENGVKIEIKTKTVKSVEDKLKKIKTKEEKAKEIKLEEAKSEKEKLQEIKQNEEITNKEKENIKDGVYRIYLKNEFIGLGTVEKGKLKRDLLLKE